MDYCAEKSKNMMNYSSPYFSYPYCSSFSLYNNPNARRPEGEKGNSNSHITPIFDEPYYEHSSCYAKSDTDSCSEGGANDAAAVEDEEGELSLDELLLDGKAKKKIEQLAAMVGVKTTEPVVVLTEVVRVLKLMKRIN
ncbi:hypothetical protein PIB30_046501 [Stylosanthes scabra]|uniref:Uncharacterized protein n=1 Tax=Stylosanthes scabra TaxID=79078 RepID=A0ABU6WHK2_9FABA|nr:hypothetical protein [Stylosanthes scabra]